MTPHIAKLTFWSIVAVSFAGFVWPTLYRPLPLNVSGRWTDQVVAARQNRFTGQIEWLPVLGDRFVPGGPVSVESSPPPRDSSEQPRDLLDTLALKARRPR
jgi:hypothetical protein